MPHKDPILATEPAAHDQDLKTVLDRLIADADFTAVRFRGPTQAVFRPC